MPDREFMYGGYVRNLANRFNEALSSIEAEYNFDFGPEFEVALCRVLRLALPHKYGICRGFVVASDGRTAGDDIVIYDRARFPTIRSLGQETYEHKEKVPIEAAYAYIEAKHTLDLDGTGRRSLSHACDQAARVKRLCSERKRVAPGAIHHYMEMKGIASVTMPTGWPDYHNPLFTAIISRNAESAPSSTRTLCPALDKHEFPEFGPDLVIAGKDHFMVPVPQNNAFDSPFLVDTTMRLVAQTSDGMAFGVGLCLLLFALDWILLGKMPWQEIIANSAGWHRDV